MEYLHEWLQHTQFLNDFGWISLDKVPDWNEIDKTARDLIQKGFFAIENHQRLFHAASFLKAYLTQSKIDELNALKTPIASRWIEFFNSTKDKIPPKDCSAFK